VVDIFDKRRYTSRLLAEPDLRFGVLTGSYATRVRSIINEASKNTTTKEILKLKKQIAYWKEQAGRMGGSEDLEEVLDDRVIKTELN
jgi:hypothetical protein